MKRQMIATILGMTMVLGSVGLAMADTPQEHYIKGNVTEAQRTHTMADTVENTSQTNALDVAYVVAADHGGSVTLTSPLFDTYDPEVGLSAFYMIGHEVDSDGNETVQVIDGNLNREDFSKVLAALELSEEEQEKRLTTYDDYVAIEKEISDICRNAEEEGNTDWTQIFDKVAKLQEKQVSPFTDDIINKALEMELLSKMDLSVSSDTMVDVVINPAN